MVADRYETSGTTYPVMQHHIPEDCISQVHHCENCECHRSGIVDMVTRLQAGQSRNHGLICSRGGRIFLFRTVSGMHLVSYSVGTRGFLVVVKWLGRETGHSSPYINVLKNEWNCTSTPRYTFMACMGTSPL
jgi:hypothetical protein